LHAATTTFYKKMSSTDLADDCNPPLNAVASCFTNFTRYDVMDVVSALNKRFLLKPKVMCCPKKQRTNL